MNLIPSKYRPDQGPRERKLLEIRVASMEGASVDVDALKQRVDDFKADLCAEFDGVSVKVTEL